MRIGLDAFGLIPNHGKGAGGELYFLNLLKHILEIDKSNYYFVIANSKLRLGFTAENMRILNVELDPEKKALRPVVQNIIVPFLIRKYKMDIIHSPFTASVVGPTGRCKKVVTVHDMVVFFRKKRWPAAKSMPDKYYRTMFPLMLRLADGIIAVSQFTKDEIVKYCGVDPNYITVIHEGPGIYGNPRQVTKNGPEKYFLTVASDRPQKNLPNYIKGISLVPPKVLESYHFIICGMICKKSTGIRVGEDMLQSLVKEYGLENSVSIRGYVSAEELRALYEGAFAVVFPSVYEGFGLPVLEAFYYEKPLLCSETASLKEIGGDAGLYFDPNNPADIAFKIQEAVSNEFSANKIVEAGRRRLSEFSWTKCARETVAVYELVNTS